MASTYSSIHLHLVFSTKDRRPFIREAEPLHAYLGGTVRGMGGVAEAIGGVDDHVHILMSLRPSHRPSDFVRELKKASSVWAKQNVSSKFEWQEGYALLSVSHGAISAVRSYISNQEAHHAKMSFLDELRALLDEAGVPYDERFLA